MSKIQQLRNKIDKIDTDIIKKLSERKNISIKIGQLKSQSDIGIKDNKREKELILNYEKLSCEYQLQLNFVKKLFKLIISNSRALQK